ncbi:hypothetical protein GMSM_04430 [Geomonas sp. Red276]
MANIVDFKKMDKTIRIFGVVQIALVGLLVFMAVEFQQKLRLLGREFRFMHGVLAAFAFQMLLFFPIFKLAGKDADRDLTVMGGTLTNEEMNAMAKKKRFSDIIKIAFLGFFVVFATAAPPDPFILSVIYYSFILTILTYLQSYNFHARKLKEQVKTGKK